MITTEGEVAFIKMLLQGDNTIVPAAGNFYLGLCDQIPSKADSLASITTEPTSAGGYARIAVTRDAAGFPTIDQVGGESRGLSIVKTFSAVGADFSRAFTRVFLTDAASGSVGTLFGYSGAYSSSILLLNGQSQNVQFAFYP